MKTGPVAELTYAWDDRDVILYALGVGARLPEDLALVYENAEGFRAAPTFALAPMTLLLAPLVRALDIDLRALLHVGQTLEIARPLPVAGRATARRRVVDVVDKGRAALVVCDDVVEDDDGPLATATSTWWVAGAGGFGSRAEAAAAKPAPPEIPARPPDRRARVATSGEQAALHRLSGDRNPVHIDPELARAAGQPRPFLHGLATLGALGLVLGRDRPLRTLDARFTRPVFPGDTLEIDVWNEGVARVTVDGAPVLGPAVLFS